MHVHMHVYVLYRLGTIRDLIKKIAGYRISFREKTGQRQEGVSNCGSFPLVSYLLHHVPDAGKEAQQQLLEMQ